MRFSKWTQLLLIIGLCAFAGCTETAPDSVTFSDPPPLADPPTWASKDGVLTGTLTAGPAQVNLDGRTATVNLFNGQYIPPVWRVNPGDTIRIRFENKMQDAPGVSKVAPLSFRRTPIARAAVMGDFAAHAELAVAAPAGSQPTTAPSFSNLHFHGFKVPPRQPGDNVFVRVDQGESYLYEVNVPKSQPEGMYWFHTHPHGYSEDQVAHGMSGVAIIGDLLGHNYPQFAAARERIMLLKDFAFGAEPPQALKTLNGKKISSISIAPGEVQFWRMANVSADSFFDMQIQDLAGRPVPMVVVAVDGNVTDRPLPSEHLLIPTGGRVEALVVGPPAGTYRLKSLNIQTGATPDNGDPNPEIVLADVISSGHCEHPVLQHDVATARPRRGELRKSLATIRTEASGALAAEHPAFPSRKITFTQDDNTNTFMIDGHAYDMNDMMGTGTHDVTIDFPTVEEWTVVNDTPELHVFHIHQLSFLLEEINGKPQPNHGYQDSVIVPFHGSIKLLMPFTDPNIVGRFVFHCHILEHEDRGMMANIVVRRRSTPGAQQPGRAGMSHP